MIGIDLVFVPEFQRQVDHGGEALLRRAFSESELVDRSVTHLAGLWAAKEAVVKAALVPPRRLSEVTITHDASGRPHANVHDQRFEVSISHHGDYVTAVALRVTP